MRGPNASLVNFQGGGGPDTCLPHPFPLDPPNFLNSASDYPDKPRLDHITHGIGCKVMSTDALGVCNFQ